MNVWEGIDDRPVKPRKLTPGEKRKALEDIMKHRTKKY